MRLASNAGWSDGDVSLFLLTPDHVTSEYVAWLADVEVARFLESRFAGHTMQTTRDYVSTMLDSETNLMLGIASRQHGHIGNIKLGPIDRAHERGEVGLMIGKREAWGRGFATRAITIVSKIASDQLGIRKLTAGCYASNGGSRKAFERAGYQIEGIRTEHFLLDGAPEDLVLLAKFTSR